MPAVYPAGSRPWRSSGNWWDVSAGTTNGMAFDDGAVSFLERDTEDGLSKGD
jgi:hypothetical protein